MFQYLNVKQLAERLNVGVNTIYRLRDAGEIEYIMIRGTVRFPEPAVDNYIKANTVCPVRSTPESDTGSVAAV